MSNEMQQNRSAAALAGPAVYRRMQCEKARGKDVVFGGCGLQTRRLEITGSVSCQAGFVQILLKNGSKEIRLTPNSSGSIAESICGAGGDWYLSVEYADFSGSVTLCSRDSTQ